MCCIVVPRESTSAAARRRGRADYGELLEAGVHIHERQGAGSARQDLSHRRRMDGHRLIQPRLA